MGVDSRSVFSLRSTRGWESVDLHSLGGDLESASRVFRARLDVETRFWDRSDGDLGQLAVNSCLCFQPVLVGISALRELRGALEEWTRSRESFEVDVAAGNYSLVLRTTNPIGIQQEHQQAFRVSYRSESELTMLEQVVVSDATVVDQLIVDLASFLDVA